MRCRSVRSRGRFPLVQRIPDESRAVEYDPGSVSGRSMYIIWFRAGDTSNAVMVAAAAGTVDLSMAIALAEKQLARLAP